MFSRLGSTGRSPVVRGRLPRTDAVFARPGGRIFFCALLKIAFGAAAECYRLAASIPNSTNIASRTRITDNWRFLNQGRALSKAPFFVVGGLETAAP
jgi:hypothetical protein